MDDVKDQTEEVSQETESEGESTENQVEESQPETQEETTDYKAELEKLRSTHKKAVGALNQERTKRKELQSELETQSEETSPEEDVAYRVAQRLQKDRVTEDLEDALDEIENLDERNLVREIYMNKLNSSGSSRRAIKNDLNDARILANKRRYQADVEKKVRKGMAEKAALESASGSVPSQKEEPEIKKVKLNKSDRAAFVKLGWKSKEIEYYEKTGEIPPK